MVENLIGLALGGGEWVLWVLVGLSVLMVAIVLEKGVVLGLSATREAVFGQPLYDALAAGDLPAALQLLKGCRGAEARLVAGLLERLAGGKAGRPGVLAEGAIIQERRRVDRYLGFLGTVGNNAPFIGLLGTVLGIIQAFNDLSLNTAGGASTVMRGVSEALVATAAGILVAIPCVAFHNYFKAVIRRREARVIGVARLIEGGAGDGRDR